MAPTIEDKLKEFVNTLQNAATQLPDGGVKFDGEALRQAVRNHQDASAEFIRRQCELAAADLRHLQFAMQIALIWEHEFKDDALINAVISRGESLESLFGEPAERKAVREWWESAQQDGTDEAQCDTCSTPLKHEEGYLLDGRYDVDWRGIRTCYGVELLCVRCFWKLRYDPENPDWRNDDDVMYIG